MLLVAQRDAETQEPAAADLYRVGVVARVRQLSRLGTGTVRVLVEGVARARVTRYVPGHAIACAPSSSRCPRRCSARTDEVLLRRTLSLFEEYVALHRRLPAELVTLIQSADSPARQAFGIAAHLGTRLDRRQGLLAIDELPALLRALGDMLTSEIDLLKLERKIDDDVRGSLFQNQREFYLQEQLKAIHRELGGEDGDDGDELAATARGEGTARSRCSCGAARAAPAAEARVDVARSGRRPHVPRLDRRAAVEGAHRRRARRRPRAPRARRGSLRSRRREGARARLHRRAVARRAARRSDSLPRRTARRRQDVARPLDRARDGTEVRAHVARRRARRGGDPRPSPHVHRRDAGPRHPGDAARRGGEPGDPARRDRQARERLPRRSVGGAARGARSRSRTRRSTITTSRSTTTSRRCCSSRRRTRSPGFPIRCATGWRSSGSPAISTRRSTRSRGSSCCRGSSSSTASIRRR